ncbi:MAG: hypothetical protein BGO27_04195 [Alphaproteobacteria bacterium 33-17]|nr:MAG: hypothetical protein BGO27_04195 [Alphaproteobacteria bacterium 33-17]
MIVLILCASLLKFISVTNFDNVFDKMESLIQALEASNMAHANEGGGEKKSEHDTSNSSKGKDKDYKPKKKPITDPSRYKVSDTAPEDSLALDPNNKCTAADYEMFSRLKQRRKDLEEREKTITDKENIIIVSERRMNEKVAEIKKLREDIRSMLNTYKTEQQEKIDSLVKIYSNMKPKEAARIFEELDMSTLLTVIARMKEAKSAPILAEMNPIKARDITIELANQKKFSEDICGCKMQDQ